MTVKYFFALSLYLIAIFVSYQLGERYNNTWVSVAGYMLSTSVFMISKKMVPSFGEDIQGNVKYSGRYVLIVVVLIVTFSIVYWFLFIS